MFHLHRTNEMVKVKPTEQPIVLDVGSAGGEPAFTIAKSMPAAKVYATDVAPAMVSQISNRARLIGVKNIVSAVADGENLMGFKDSSVDAVTCTHGLMFMPQWERAIQ
ncbi:unnamed protein product, partial [Discosporangium mesarthrocarpum]